MHHFFNRTRGSAYSVCDALYVIRRVRIYRTCSAEFLKPCIHCMRMLHMRVQESVVCMGLIHLRKMCTNHGYEIVWRHQYLFFSLGYFFAMHFLDPVTEINQ